MPSPRTAHSCRCDHVPNPRGGWAGGFPSGLNGDGQLPDDPAACSRPRRQATVPTRVQPTDGVPNRPPESYSALVRALSSTPGVQRQPRAAGGSMWRQGIHGMERGGPMPRTSRVPSITCVLRESRRWGCTRPRISGTRSRASPSNCRSTLPQGLTPISAAPDRAAIALNRERQQP